MSYLARNVVRAPRVIASLPSRSLASSSFHTSPTLLALSESDHDHSTDTPDRDAKIETHKQDSVSRAKAGKGEWKPELASNSEQAVQQDKHNMSMDEMQKVGEKKAESGKNPSGSK